MMRTFFTGLIFFLLNPAVSYTQQEDTLLYARNTPFLKALMQRTDHIYPIEGSAQGIVKPTYKHSSLRAQWLIKSKNDLYLFIDWTGILYKSVSFTDSVIKFHRIDSTININYNGGGWPYLYNNEIHVLGGYSFWKTNGTDKKFNVKDMQWDVVPLSEEIIPQIYPNTILWHDVPNASVWIPYERTINVGIRDPEYQAGKINPFCYRLDLNSQTWIKQGRTAPELIDLLSIAAFNVQTPRGVLLLSGNYLYLLNFEKNQVLRSTDFSTFQSYSRIVHTEYKYFQKNIIYHYYSEQKKYDSLLMDLDKFEILKFPIYKNSSSVWIPWFVSIFLIVSILLGIYFTRYSMRNVSVNSHQLEVATNQEIEKNDASEFTDTEQNLIDLLIQKSKKSETATLAEINYVLGVKEKNIGLQKKVRSDVINSINKKYRIKTGDSSPWIQSVRSQNDKRYFEYFVDKPLFKEN